MNRLFIIILAFLFFPLFLIARAMKKSAVRSAERLGDLVYDLRPEFPWERHARLNREAYYHRRRRRMYGYGYPYGYGTWYAPYYGYGYSLGFGYPY